MITPIKKAMCKNCGHTIAVFTNLRGQVPSLFNGKWVHLNINQKWAGICRVKRCNCLKPEPEENE